MVSFSKAMSGSTALGSPMLPSARAAESLTLPSSSFKALRSGSTASGFPISPRMNAASVRVFHFWSFNKGISSSTACLPPISPRASAAPPSTHRSYSCFLNAEIRGFTARLSPILPRA